jgi:hypothetical protein
MYAVHIKSIGLCLTLSLALAFGASGCGSGGGERATTTTDPTLTKAQWVRQADAVCAKVDQRQATLYGKLNQLPSPPAEDEAAWFEYIVVPPLESEVEELASLGLPKESRKAVEGFLDAFAVAVDKAAESPAVILTGSPFKAAEELALRVGFKTCEGGA